MSVFTGICKSAVTVVATTCKTGRGGSKLGKKYTKLCCCDWPVYMACAFDLYI